MTGFRYEARLRDTLPRVRERLAAALQRAGRDAAVAIVAVTKGHPPEAVVAARDAGLRLCGENRVQELAAKVEALGRGIVEWHLIGHLQTNKVRRALALFDVLDSIDSLRLAQELAREAERAQREVVGLVQVNTAGEATKGGFDAEEAVAGVASVCELPRLRVIGLMCMAPLTDDAAVLRRTFARTRAVFEECARAVPRFEARHLSMGMSNDFELAVEEGSTLVRLGTVLFGERSS